MHSNIKKYFISSNYCIAFLFTSEAILLGCSSVD